VDLYRRVFSPEFRAPYGNVTRWFTTLVNQPQFAKVIGKVDFSAKEEVAAAHGQKQQHGGGGGGGGGKPKPEKKEQPKKEQKPKEQPKKAAAEEEDDDTPKEEKKKNPLDLLPPSKMNLDSTKKLYFEKRPKFDEFFAEFWNFFDAEGYSIWFADYQYNAENTVSFMTANLVSGFLQRLEDWRKYAFGSVVMLGKDEDTAPFNVHGVFIFRGKEFPAALKSDVPDAEYYTWRQANVAEEADRKAVEARFYADDVDGQHVLERKYFK